METASDRVLRSREKIKEAARRILEISNELHLNLNEFEQVLREIKRISILTLRERTNEKIHP